MDTNLQHLYHSLSQQDNHAVQQFVLNPDVVDDWLADELCQSGILLNSTPLSEGDQKKLPHSPPISPSSVNKKPTSDDSSRVSNVSLFPEMAQAKHTPILPKLAATNPNASFPKLAPRPTTHLPQPPIKIAPFSCIPHPPKRPLSEKEQEDVISKRQKNTDAARRSRLKKLLKMEQLEKQVSELETDKQKLTTRVAVLESEKLGLESKSASHENRIKILEIQLAEAHRALTKPSCK